MTPREIILANLEHRNPERPGLTFTGDRLCDVVYAGVGASETWTPRRWSDERFEYYDDEWGNIWHRMIDGCKSGEVIEPALRDWKSLETLRIPDFDVPSRFDDMRQAFANSGDSFRLAFVPGWVFATSRYLRTMEVYFTDLIEYREKIDHLHAIVTGLFERVIHRCADAGADGITFCEDLGVQDRLLISPAMWRDVMRSHYLRLTGAAHARGMKVLMHSCGYIWELLDDLANAGIDCFQFDQPALYVMPALADRLKQLRVALWSPVDIQQVMPTGNRALIESEAERMVRLFKGFLIMKNYGDLPGIGVEEEWDRWAYEAILRAITAAPC